LRQTGGHAEPPVDGQQNCTVLNHCLSIKAKAELRAWQKSEPMNLTDAEMMRVQSGLSIGP
jgi:hypothetical protein